MVGANLEVMKGDALRMRGTRPFVFSIMKGGRGPSRSDVSSSKRGDSQTGEDGPPDPTRRPADTKWRAAVAGQHLDAC